MTLPSNRKDRKMDSIMNVGTNSSKITIFIFKKKKKMLKKWKKIKKETIRMDNIKRKKKKLRQKLLKLKKIRKRKNPPTKKKMKSTKLKR